MKEILPLENEVESAASVAIEDTSCLLMIMMMLYCLVVVIHIIINHK